MNWIVFTELRVYLASLPGSHFYILLSYGEFETIKTSLCYDKRASWLNSSMVSDAYLQTHMFFLCKTLMGKT